MPCHPATVFNVFELIDNQHAHDWRTTTTFIAVFFLGLLTMSRLCLLTDSTNYDMEVCFSGTSTAASRASRSHCSILGEPLAAGSHRNIKSKSDTSFHSPALKLPWAGN